jgi:hypothetical protein
MQAIKIATHIKNGIITLPAEYRYLNQDVEIIVLAEHFLGIEEEEKRKKKDRLLLHLKV